MPGMSFSHVLQRQRSAGELSAEHSWAQLHKLRASKTLVSSWNAQAHPAGWTQVTKCGHTLPGDLMAKGCFDLLVHK